MRLTVLGCSGSFPGPASACSGYLVQSETANVWIDAGSGTLANLQRHIPLERVDALVLSHEHPDHWADLEGFHVANAYAIERFGVPIYAPTSLRDFLYQWNRPAFEWHDIADGQTRDVAGMQFTFSRTDHGPETLAMRIESGGTVLGYSADTGPGWHLSKLGEGVDVALCEATFLAEQEGTTQHLSARQAAVQANEAGITRLFLTHFWPFNDREATRKEAEAVFEGTVTVVEENGIYDL
jgi:ribonuclease BN (tRNA processing enzyme)